MNPVFEFAQAAVIAGDASGLEALLKDHAEILRRGNPPPYVPRGPGPTYRDEAQQIIAREHRFETWEAYAQHVDAVRQADSAIARFEAAVESIVEGDVATLRRLLREHPDLIRARSPRTHHSTLLHYVAANGIEGFRQRTPQNAVEVAELLLHSGADVDATADIYGGGSTALGLVATSIHPQLAGVQLALLDVLLVHGATIDTGGQGAVIGCLANGRGEAAEFLASRGARLDLEGAAGVGRLDVVARYFDDAGHLKNATAAQLTDGFAWACEFGRTGVVDLLLRHGMDANARLKHHGQTGLHWAALGGHLETVRLLLDRQAKVDIKDEAYGGTPLGWALYGWGNLPSGASGDSYYHVAARLVAAGATVDFEWLAAPDRELPLATKVRGDPRMAAALRLTS